MAIVGGGEIDDCLHAVVSDMPQGKATLRIALELVGPKARIAVAQSALSREIDDQGRGVRP
jgi:hypothetical protein